MMILGTVEAGGGGVGRGFYTHDDSGVSIF